MNYAEYQERRRCLCLIFDASTTSGVRTKKRNSSLKGSAKTSTHMLKYGFADDLVPDDLSRIPEMARVARKLELFAKVYRNHLHIGFRTRS